jgi:hypothetical protein
VAEGVFALSSSGLAVGANANNFGSDLLRVKPLAVGERREPFAVL